MYRNLNQLSIVLLLLALVFGCASTSTTVTKAQIVSMDEKAIQAVFIEYEKAWNRQDAKGVIVFFHQNAQIMTGAKRKIVSTEEYVNIVPQKFEQVGSMTFDDPKIEITGDKAKVAITSQFSRGVKEVKFIFSMVLQNNKWLIMKQEY